MKERTAFGKFTAMLRVKHDQKLHDMAEVLNVSTAFLSKTEHGIAKPILAWVDILSENYSLTMEEAENLREIISKERSKSSICINHLEINDQYLITTLIKTISSMPEDKKEKIKNLILDSKNGR